MSDCGLPNEFCFIELKRGVKVIGSICVLASGICSILLLVYLCSDFDAIKEELSDKEENVMGKLDESKTGNRKFLILLRIKLNYYFCHLWIIYRLYEFSLSRLYVL